MTGRKEGNYDTVNKLRKSFSLKKLVHLNTFLPLSTMLALSPEQHPDLQHQLLTVVMDTNGRCYRLCS